MTIKIELVWYPTGPLHNVREVCANTTRDYGAFDDLADAQARVDEINRYRADIASRTAHFNGVLDLLRQAANDVTLPKATIEHLVAMRPLAFSNHT